MKAHPLPTLALATLLLAGCSFRPAENTGPSAASAVAPAATSPGQAGEGDRAFIDGMVPHHEMALMMADEAQYEAKRQELKDFAVQVKGDQRAEILEMKGWRKAWFGSDETPPMDHGAMKPLPKGAAYDAAWAREMIVHHQGAIDMAKVALTKAQRAEVKAMAQRIIDAQLAEQVKLEAWAKAWGG